MASEPASIPFDHAPILTPEYHAASQALHALANSDRVDLTGEAFLDAVREMAAALPYASPCPECRFEGQRVGWPALVAPYAMAADRDQLAGRYECPACGVGWMQWH